MVQAEADNRKTQTRPDSGRRQQLAHNIVLIGFMGSGKTSLGRHLAKVTGFDCYDLDEIIQRMTGQTVSELFASRGEAYFRECESEAVASLQWVERAVIACGGGVVLAAANVDNLRRCGKLVWLQARPQTIYDRLRQHSDRPLLNGKGPEDIAAMLAARQRLYDEAADYAVVTDGKPVAAVGADILGLLAGGKV